MCARQRPSPRARRATRTSRCTRPSTLEPFTPRALRASAVRAGRRGACGRRGQRTGGTGPRSATRRGVNSEVRRRCCARRRRRRRHRRAPRPRWRWHGRRAERRRVRRRTAHREALALAQTRVEAPGEPARLCPTAAPGRVRTARGRVERAPSRRAGGAVRSCGHRASARPRRRRRRRGRMVEPFWPSRAIYGSRTGRAGTATRPWRFRGCGRCGRRARCGGRWPRRRPPPPSRTKWTRRVPHPVLTGHEAGAGGPVDAPAGVDRPRQDAAPARLLHDGRRGGDSPPDAQAAHEGVGQGGAPPPLPPVSGHVSSIPPY